jgi:hypothetical protein
MSRRPAKTSVTAGTIAGSIAGLVLVLIPEPATTLTGAAMIAAIWAPKLKGGK